MMNCFWRRPLHGVGQQTSAPSWTIFGRPTLLLPVGQFVIFVKLHVLNERKINVFRAKNLGRN